MGNQWLRCAASTRKSPSAWSHSSIQLPSSRTYVLCSRSPILPSFPEQAGWWWNFISTRDHWTFPTAHFSLTFVSTWGTSHSAFLTENLSAGLAFLIEICQPVEHFSLSISHWAFLIDICQPRDHGAFFTRHFSLSILIGICQAAKITGFLPCACLRSHYQAALLIAIIEIKSAFHLPRRTAIMGEIMLTSIEGLSPCIFLRYCYLLEVYVILSVIK
jgi:hypothetical protein